MVGCRDRGLLSGVLAVAWRCLCLLSSGRLWWVAVIVSLSVVGRSRVLVLALVFVVECMACGRCLWQWDGLW